MKMNKSVLVLLTIVSLLSAWSGGTARNQIERSQNRKQVNKGKENMKRDGEELKQFQSLIKEYSTADSASKPKIEKDILTAMKRELGQTKNLIKSAEREVKQSTREVRSDRREIQHNREDEGRYKSDDDKLDMANDRINKIDDQVDRVDDVIDVKKLKGVLEKQQQIYGGAEKQFKIELAGGFAKTMKALIDLQKAELKEDQAERVEDVRESSDDRRERREEDEPADSYQGGRRRR